MPGKWFDKVTVYFTSLVFLRKPAVLLEKSAFDLGQLCFHEAGEKSS